MSRHHLEPGGPRRRSVRERFETVFRPAPFVPDLPDQQRSPNREDITLPPDFIIHLR